MAALVARDRCVGRQNAIQRKRLLWLGRMQEQPVRADEQLDIAFIQAPKDEQGSD